MLKCSSLPNCTSFSFNFVPSLGLNRSNTALPITTTMDFSNLINIIARRKWLILGAMLVAAALTYSLIGMKPESYRSTAVVSTSILNYKGIGDEGGGGFVQPFQIENGFANLIEFIRSRATIKLMTIEMLRHDLEERVKNGKPFRQPNMGLAKFSDEDARYVLSEIKKISLDSLSEDLILNSDLEYKMDQIARAYGYDNDALLNSLSVKRKAATDYITVDFVTESPALSQHMANVFSKRMINYRYNIMVREKKKNVEAFAQLVAQKKAVVDSIKNALFGYLYQRGLPNIGRQSEETVMQMSQLEMEKREAESRLRTATESMGRYQKYIEDKSGRGAGDTRSRVADKSLVQEKSNRVSQLTQKSLETGGKDEEVEAQLAEARREYDKAVRSSARTLGRAKAPADGEAGTRDDLYQKKVDADIERIAAQNALDDISRRISTLNGKLSTLVSNDEVATTLSADQKRADDELATVNAQYIKAKLSYENTENPLHIVETARLPEWPEPNRQVLLSAFAAIVIGSLAVIALFLMAYFDNTLQSPDVLKQQTKLPMLGAISAVPVKGLDLGRVFAANSPDSAAQYTAFREGLRKIRSNIILSEEHTFLIVSTQAKEGKTFAMHGLAYSLAANNKRVLMLDTNFKMPLPLQYTDLPTPHFATLNQIIKSNGMSEIFREKRKTSASPGDEHLVDIIGNSGLDRSPAELLKPEQFRKFLTDLREHYDYIFMEAAPLNLHSDAQELEPYADKIIAVFNASSTIRSADKESLQYLQSLGNKFMGSLLTGVSSK